MSIRQWPKHTTKLTTASWYCTIIASLIGAGANFWIWQCKDPAAPTDLVMVSQGLGFMASNTAFLYGQAKLWEWIVGKNSVEEKPVEDVEMGDMSGNAMPGDRGERASGSEDWTEVYENDITASVFTGWDYYSQITLGSTPSEIVSIESAKSDNVSDHYIAIACRRRRGETGAYVSLGQGCLCGHVQRWWFMLMYIISLQQAKTTKTGTSAALATILSGSKPLLLYYLYTIIP
jgi:hypothetical protein